MYRTLKEVSIKKMEAKRLTLSAHLIVKHDQVVINCQNGPYDRQSLFKA